MVGIYLFLGFHEFYGVGARPQRHADIDVENRIVKFRAPFRLLNGARKSRS